jgi:hypothetical protein
LFLAGSAKQWFSSSSSSDDKKTLPNDFDDEQPPGTASITFEEKEEEVEGNEAPHPADSLEGDRDTYTAEIVVRMPDMGEGNDNKVEEWYKKPGDVIKRNDILCDITTPDFTFGMVTEDEGDALMGEIHVQAGEMAIDNAPICTIYHQAKPEDDKEKEV